MAGCTGPQWNARGLRDDTTVECAATGAPRGSPARHTAASNFAVLGCDRPREVTHAPPTAEQAPGQADRRARPPASPLTAATWLPLSKALDASASSCTQTEDCFLTFLRELHAAKPKPLSGGGLAAMLTRRREHVCGWYASGFLLFTERYDYIRSFSEIFLC
jgi:hypothetical protein